MYISMGISSTSLLLMGIPTLTHANYLAMNTLVTPAPDYQPLQARQVIVACDPGWTSCIGWDGCCPQGAPCTVIQGQRGCKAECSGFEICGHLCCDGGYHCSANSVCVKSGYDIPTVPVFVPTVSVSVPTVLQPTLTSTTESDGIYTILSWSTDSSITRSSAMTMVSSGQVSSGGASSVSTPSRSSAPPASSSPVSDSTSSLTTSQEVTSSPGSTTTISPLNPTQTVASAASVARGNKVLAWMLALILGIVL